MAHSNKRNGGHKNHRVIISADAKRSIAGVAFFAIGAVFLLAFFGLSGPVGKVIFNTFSFLMGWGYIMLPAAFFVMALIAIKTPPQHMDALLLGVGMIVASILGVSHQLKPDQAGFFGMTFGSISALFGFWATLVILGALGISGIFIVFRGPIKMAKEKRETPPQVEVFKEIKQEKPREVRGKREVHESEQSDSEELAVARRSFLKSWDLPPVDLFEYDTSKPTAGDVRVNANVIKKTLENFGIPVEMAEIHIGPTVTQYTLKPAQGVKLAKIVALQNDLALSLAVHPIRIEAPIPGKSLVGIEAPNKVAAAVRLRTLFADTNFSEEKSPLAFFLGRDVMGAPMIADLSRMPHLLVAGATGSGKSIFIHSMITSYLFRNPPHLLRFLLIDPKRVELSQYQGIPHLLAPVITDGKRAVQSLRWAIHEMDRRYAILLGAHNRDVSSYNASRGRENGSEMLPFIVIFIDELADLMAAFGREIEGAIVRLAQMARATGIHLVVSTQRPSVEVITGLIKANITSRIAFQVVSQIDSRTIIDMAGAEKLVGSGDMLFLAPDTSKPKRIQAPYVADREIKRVVEFITKQGEELEIKPPTEVEEEIEEAQALGSDKAWLTDENDPLYNEAMRVVREARKASASLLQRRLKIGYARAARLLDIMESRGIVGPGEGAKPREVIGFPERRDEII